MANDRRANLVLAGGLVGIFVLLMALEAFSDQDGISLSEFAFEGLEFCLVIVIASGIIRLVQWLKKKDEEQQMLVHDLQIARAQNLR